MICPFCNAKMHYPYYQGYICQDKNHKFVYEKIYGREEYTLNYKQFVLTKINNDFHNIEIKNNRISLQSFDVEDMGLIIRKYDKLKTFS